MKLFNLAFALVALVLAGCGQQQSSTETTSTPPPATTEAATIDTSNAVTTDATGTRVKLFVTEDGFVPARVAVAAGKPVTLAITRTTDKTCATELVMKEQALNVALPLNQTVEATFTPAKSGELTYACGMDMYKGTIVVQ